MDTSRQKALTIPIRRDLVEESGSAFSKFAEEIPSIVLNETDLKHSFLNVLSVISILNIRALQDNNIGLERSNKPSHSYATRDVHENISADEWTQSMSYNEGQVEVLLKSLLNEYELEESEENLGWLRTQILDYVESYENKYDLRLPQPFRTALFNLALKMAYDRLSVKQNL
jgi:hypothetical protein